MGNAMPNPSSNGASSLEGQGADLAGALPSDRERLTKQLSMARSFGLQYALEVQGYGRQKPCSVIVQFTGDSSLLWIPRPEQTGGKASQLPVERLDLVPLASDRLAKFVGSRRREPATRMFCKDAASSRLVRSYRRRCRFAFEFQDTPHLCNSCRT
jgi:hypothetical protein